MHLLIQKVYIGFQIIFNKELQLILFKNKNK